MRCSTAPPKSHEVGGPGFEYAAHRLTVPMYLRIFLPMEEIFEKNFLKATSLKKILREVALFLVDGTEYRLSYRTVPLSSMVLHSVECNKNTS